MKKYATPILEITNISGNDIIMYSQEAILADGERLMAAHDSWFGMEIE